MTKFYKILFFNSLIVSSLITMSSYSWMIMWLGLEINIMSFIPLIYDKKSIYSSEATMKYFIIQTLASTMLIFSMIMMETKFLLTFSMNFNWSLLMIYSSLLMKMGMAPFHFWFPEVAEGLSWFSNLILMTWQKIAPMSIIMMITFNSYIVIISILFSSLVGSMMGLNQISLRKIMAYSSINHMAWMMLSMMNSFFVWLIYYLIYSITNYNLIYLFNKFNIFNINQLNTLKLPLMSKTIMMMNFLSLAGMPPTIGFFPKWLVISYSTCNNQVIMPTILIVTTLMAIYFYLRIMFPSILLKTSYKTIMISNYKMNFYFMVWNYIFIMSLFITMLWF